MAWFADLTPYSYLVAESAPALNVGWLENGNAFETGDVPAGLIERLDLLEAHASTVATRGQHECDLCPPTEDEDALYWWGCAELRAVGADGTRFAAPTLIGHYVAAHQYRPPQAFIDAVLRVSLAWPEAEAGDLCFSCATKMKRTEVLDGYVRGATREPILLVKLACEPCGTTYSRAFPELRPT